MHHCSCGLTHTAEQWNKLAFVGIQDLGLGLSAELRNCTACNSTRSVELPVRHLELVRLCDEHTKLTVRETQRIDLMLAEDEQRRHEQRARDAIGAAFFASMLVQR